MMMEKMVQRRRLRVIGVLSAATMAGVGAGHAVGQTFNINTAWSPSASTANPFYATDDAPDNTTVAYIGQTVQSIQLTTVPNGNIIGAGDPYITGILTYGVRTSTPGFGSNGYTSSQNAYYYDPSNPSGGIHFFGQVNSSSGIQYTNNGGTSKYNVSDGASDLPTAFSTLVHTAAVYGENTAGTVIATEGLQAADSTSSNTLGQHAYAYNIPTNTYTSLGFTTQTPDPASYNVSYGINFNYANTSSSRTQATYYYSTVSGIDSAGDITGTSYRYYNYGGAVQTSVPSQPLGVSTWFFNASNGQTYQTGLYGTGDGYFKNFTGTGAGSGFYSSQNDKGVNGGYEIGQTSRYIDLGTGSGSNAGFDYWEYNSATNTTTAIGLAVAGWTPTVAGFSGNTYSYSYTVAGVTGGGRNGAVNALNASGLVGGSSTYYLGTSSVGNDAWVYNPAGGGSYTQAGFLTNGFASGGTSSFVSTTGARSSTVGYIANNGMIAGTSTQYVSSLPSGAGNLGSGTIAWYANAGSYGSPNQIGLTDSLHTAHNSSGYSYSVNTLSELSNTGLIAGSALRYTPGTDTQFGKDAWVYDSNTNQTYVMEPTAAEWAARYSSVSPTLTNSDFFYSSITYLSDSGFAVGYWSGDINSNMNGVSPPATEYGFLWVESTNTFIDLSSDVVPSLNTSNLSAYQAIYNAYYVNAAGTEIYANGGPDNGNGVQSAVPTGIFVLSVPEPATLGLILPTAVVGLLCRRKRV